MNLLAGRLPKCAPQKVNFFWEVLKCEKLFLYHVERYFSGYYCVERKTVAIRIEQWERKNQTCLLRPLVAYQNARLKKWIYSREVLKCEKLHLHHIDRYFSGYYCVEKKSVVFKMKVWERKNQPCLLRPLVAYQNARHKYDYCGLNSDLCDVRF